MTSPEGKKTTYAYNAAGRLTRINNYTGKYTYAYNANGQRTKLTYPNGAIATYHYNKNGDVNKIVHAMDSTIIDEITYTYNKVNNRITRTDRQTSANYGYDAISRLLSSSLGENYTYDGVGNRLTGPKTTDVMTYNDGNEQLNLNAIAYEYDQNGNRIKKTGAGGVVTNYTYDDENRLIQVTKSNGTVITYTYDPMGRRIEKNVKGTITTYVYDNEAIILAYNAAGNIKAKYTHGLNIDEPLAVKKSGDIYYYHADGLGSIIALTDATGAVVETYSYDSFGKMTKTGDINQPFTYTAREFDQETGLYYYRARYYDPKVGRFLQRDPIGFAGGDYNLFTYVKNNPVNWVDPWGLFTYWESSPGATGKLAGEALAAANCMEKCMGKSFIVSGGSEKTGHGTDSKHYTDQAFDMYHGGHDRKKTFCCALECNIKYIKDESTTANHWHFQTVPGLNGSKGVLPTDDECCEE